MHGHHICGRAVAANKRELTALPYVYSLCRKLAAHPNPKSRCENPEASSRWKTSAGCGCRRISSCATSSIRRSPISMAFRTFRTIRTSRSRPAGRFAKICSSRCAKNSGAFRSARPIAAARWRASAMSVGTIAPSRTASAPITSGTGATPKVSPGRWRRSSSTPSSPTTRRPAIGRRWRGGCTTTCPIRSCSSSRNSQPSIIGWREIPKRRITSMIPPRRGLLTKAGMPNQTGSHEHEYAEFLGSLERT